MQLAGLGFNMGPMLFATNCNSVFNAFISMFYVNRHIYYSHIAVSRLIAMTLSMLGGLLHR